jgi:hypothetical protein
VGPARLARALFFRDRRVKGEPSPPYRHYLWNKALAFSAAPEIAAYVAANTAPDETISGSSTATPLVALLAGRRVAGDEADTNNKRFRSGMLSDRAYWDEVCADKLRFVLAQPRSRFTVSYMDRDPTAVRYFQRDRAFRTRCCDTSAPRPSSSTGAATGGCVLSAGGPRLRAGLALGRHHAACLTGARGRSSCFGSSEARHRSEATDPTRAHGPHRAAAGRLVGEVLDLSAAGMRVRTMAVIPVESVIDVKVEHRGRLVPARMTVVWADRPASTWASWASWACRWPRSPRTI